MSLELATEVVSRRIQGGQYELYLRPSGLIVATIESHWGGKCDRKKAAEDVARLLNEFWVHRSCSGITIPGLPRFTSCASSTRWVVKDHSSNGQVFLSIAPNYGTVGDRLTLMLRFSNLLNVFYEGP